MSVPDPQRPVLVTGGTGFIGRRLVARLCAAGRPVRVLVPPAEPPPDREGGVEICRGDLADAAAVERAVAGTGCVFHLAAVVGDWGPAALFEEVTVAGTRRVLAAAAAAGIPVVLASSIVVYGHRLGREICREDVPHGRPYGPYSRAKQAQERLARAAVAAGADVRTVRPANVYGPGSRIWLDEVVRALKTGAPSLVNGGRQNAGLVHVDHVADVLLRAGGPGAVAGSVYNACDGLDVSWARYFGDLARLAEAPAPRSAPGWLAWPLAAVMEGAGRLLGRAARPVLTREALHLVSANHRVPAERARDELGHEPRVGYAEAVAACAADLAERGLIRGERTGTAA